MFFGSRTISQWDHGKLVDSARRARDSWVTYAPCVDRLRADLRRADVVASGEVPGDLITMNSRVVIRHAHSGKTGLVTLVYPEYEDADAGKVSVLSPMGQALLGARVGDEVVWLSHQGPEVATVESIPFQPESAARGESPLRFEAIGS